MALDPQKANKEYDVTYKVLLLGDSGVGKTALIRKLMGDGFIPNHVSTVGIDFVKKVFDIDGVKIQLQIWDTAGQERFRTITKFQYRGAKGVMVLYDITNKNTFDMLDYWLRSIEEELDKDNEDPIPVYILGNKNDLKEKRQVSYESGRKISEKHYSEGFFETSAKDGENVEKSFRGLAMAVTEHNDPKLMESYLTPYEKQQKRISDMEPRICNGKCRCGGLPPKPPKDRKKLKDRLSRVKTEGDSKVKTEGGSKVKTEGGSKVKTEGDSNNNNSRGFKLTKKHFEIRKPKFVCCAVS